MARIPADNAVANCFPGMAILTFTRAYLVVPVFSNAYVMIFIGKEEEQLTKAFGREYEEYKEKIPRLVPFGMRLR